MHGESLPGRLRRDYSFDLGALRIRRVRLRLVMPRLPLSMLGGWAPARDPAWMNSSELLDAAGRRRSPATMPGFHYGRPRRNKGRTYPADLPTVEEIVAVMRRAGDRPPGLRTRALIVLLWRAGLRINEALSLAESDLDPARGSILIRRGKGGRRRQVGMDAWGGEHLDRWLEIRVTMPVGALLCVLAGPTGGRPWSATAARGPCAISPCPPASAAASLRISSATRMPSRWLARAYH